MLKLVRVKIKSVVDGIFKGDGHTAQQMEGDYLQHFGLRSRPKSGADGVVLSLPNGQYLIASNDRCAINIADGEVCIYATDKVKIHLKADNSMAIDCSDISVKATGIAQINCKDITIGDIDGLVEKMLKAESFKKHFDSHVHGGNLGAPTTPPQIPMPPTLFSKEVKNS